MDYFIWNIEPIAFSVGFVKVRWYGLMFACAFLSSYFLMTWIYKREGKNNTDIDDLLTYTAIGTIAGARLAHCLFYNPEYYFSNPLKIFAIWEGGLASHGAIAGIILSLYFFQRRVSETFTWFIDRISLVSTLGACFIRIGNFFNSEIVGEPTTMPWGIVFQRVDLLPRHPVQLYEAMTYFIIFLLLLIIYLKVDLKKTPGVVFATSLMTVFTARFFLEFIKTKQSAYNNDFWMSTGQMLSIPFVLAGLFYILIPIFRKN